MVFKKPTKAIITDAGYASRFLPITKTIPKAMLPLGAKPVIQYAVEECLAAGINEIIIVATPEGKPIYENYFFDPASHIHELLQAQSKEDRYKPVQEVLDFPKIHVIVQGRELPYGNGTPIVCARDFIADDEAFVVIYSDDLVFGASDVQTMVETYAQHPEAKGIIMAQEKLPQELHKYGIISLKDGDKLDNIIEKPPTGQAPSTLASYGRYLLTAEVFEYLKFDNLGLDNELWTVDAITKLAETGDVLVVKTKGEWVTTGDPKNYFLAYLQYALNHEDYAAAVRDMVNKI
jgi:UTP--glucose-1-phosphate uridylyltransferase